MPGTTIRYLISTVLLVFIFYTKAGAQEEKNHIFIRLSEIDIVPDSLASYLSILKAESAASVRLEPGVISIFPMYKKEDSSQVRILEIYADSAAYKKHLQTPHFLHYKTTTLKMVKSLRLIDMYAIDESMMPGLFVKMQSR